MAFCKELDPIYDPTMDEREPPVTHLRRIERELIPDFDPYDLIEEPMDEYGLLSDTIAQPERIALDSVSDRLGLEGEMLLNEAETAEDKTRKWIKDTAEARAVVDKINKECGGGLPFDPTEAEILRFVRDVKKHRAWEKEYRALANDRANVVDATNLVLGFMTAKSKLGLPRNPRVSTNDRSEANKSANHAQLTDKQKLVLLRDYISLIIADSYERDSG